MSRIAPNVVVHADVRPLDIVMTNLLENAVVTDVVMPGISGHVLGERLAESVGKQRILYTSGYIDDALVRNGLQADGSTLYECSWVESGQGQRSQHFPMLQNAV